MRWWNQNRKMHIMLRYIDVINLSRSSHLQIANIVEAINLISGVRPIVWLLSGYVSTQALKLHAWPENEKKKHSAIIFCIIKERLVWTRFISSIFRGERCHVTLPHYSPQQSKMTRCAENDWKRLQITSSVHLNVGTFTVMHHSKDPLVILPKTSPCPHICPANIDALYT